MDESDRRILNALQGGFPLCERPFAQVAKDLGLAEEQLIARIRAMLEEGSLTRFGPLYNVERMGGTFTLCAMRVPPEAFERVAAVVNARPEVAHNYEREHALNMWFVLATAEPVHVAAVVRDIERRSGCTVLQLPKLDEYFLELRLAV